MLPRTDLEDRVRAALGRARVVALIGARQTGKSTLARRFLPPEDPNYLDLEDHEAEALMAQPLTALRERRGLVVIDEVQRAPEVFKTLLRLIQNRRGKSVCTGETFPAEPHQESPCPAKRGA